jgi:hypothetical protein
MPRPTKAFDKAEAEEQRLHERPAIEGHTAPHDANLKAPPSGGQPGA